MIIHLCAQAGLVAPAPISISTQGEVLHIGADQIDLSVLSEGDIVPAEAAATLHPALCGPITREGGTIHVTLLWQYDPACTDQWVTHPDPVETLADGPVDLPWATWSEITEAPAAGGRNIVTTIHRWHQPAAPEPQGDE